MFVIDLENGLFGILDTPLLEDTLHMYIRAFVCAPILSQDNLFISLAKYYSSSLTIIRLIKSQHHLKMVRLA